MHVRKVAAAAAVWLSTGSIAQAEPAERIDRTAHTLRAGEVNVGLSTVAVGIIDRITVGTYVPTWLLFPWVGAPVPTGFLKLSTPMLGPAQVGVRVNVIYLSSTTLASELAGDQAATGALWMAPIEGGVSVRVAEPFTQSAELMYVATSLHGDSTGAAEVRGSAASSSFTLSSFSEVRVSDALAFTLLGRVLLHQDALRVRGTAQQGQSSVDFDLAVRRRQSFVACIVPGVELDFGALHMDLGIGYGNWWLPVLELPLTSYTVVPQADVYVRF